MLTNYIILGILRCLPVKSDFYSAISGQEILLESQFDIIRNLEAYIGIENSKIEKVKRYQRNNRVLLIEAQHLGNPFFYLRIISRLSTELDIIEDILRETEFKFSVHEEKLPTKEDLNGAATGVIRLQQTYRLNVTQLANGNLRGIRSTPMTADDCYRIDQYSDSPKDARYSVKWLEEAFNRYKKIYMTLYSYKKDEIVKQIIACCYVIGDRSNATKWIKTLASIIPGMDASILEELVKNKIKSSDTQLTKNELRRKEYDILCRNRFQLPPIVKQKLKCRYLLKPHSFLIIAPIKVEDVYLKPDILLMYDVLSDNEIEALKDLAKPIIRKARVTNSTGYEVEKPIRVTKLAWLHQNISSVVAKVNRRASAMTGLNVDTGENLQVANYGIGGQFEFHHDFIKNISLKDWPAGNRLATVLFYLSNVQLGGATVFRQLGVHVKPVKGAALLWDNLGSSGNGDVATEHGACPVLYGSKWGETVLYMSNLQAN